ncbi:shikimate kinase [Clostridium botulinum]|uniref:shikimate kinase n=1 Tax=Clostridium botulinum TaxID=1491 RepID=UPI0005977FF3|nr:shikimate kinase [Clostridium botulinum]KIL07940.1 shikimate kinase [Clostridium botulinum]MBY6933723.1 shikimate kinase [Clostridium botulinum]NFL83756.1 shikimate kinase [Clostridium botulinum]NFN10367.1 shikimate kinase [Clostridium botulinum]NFO35533.1 shikimate kinase [Clostridium botulinum]
MKNKVFLIGMPGCGKSTIGELISKELLLKFIDMDIYIEEKTSKTISELFEQGEDYFRDIESEACKEIIKYDNVVIATGGGVVKKDGNVETLKNNGLVIFIDRPVEKIISDIDVSRRPLLKNGKERIIGLYKERYDIYKKACHKIVVNDGTIDEVIEEIKKIIINN